MKIKILMKRKSKMFFCGAGFFTEKGILYFCLYLLYPLGYNKVVQQGGYISEKSYHRRHQNVSKSNFTVIATELSLLSDLLSLRDNSCRKTRYSKRHVDGCNQNTEVPPVC